MSRLIKIFLIVALLGLGTTVLAQETQPVDITEAIELDEEVLAEDLEIGEPQVLPDHPLYFLKNWGRGIRLFFAFNSEVKARLRLKFANEKLLELNKIVGLKKDSKLIEKVLESFQKDLEEIEKTNPENLKKFSEKLMHQQLLHQRILQRLETQVPPEVFEKIKENRERHLERFTKVMLRVEENFPEKLEEVLEKQKGSQFKDFKNLEILKEIEEKLPEEIRERVREQVQERILNRLYENLEKMPEENREKLREYVGKISGDKVVHLRVLAALEGQEISGELEELLEEVRREKIEEIEEIVEITFEMAQEQIGKAEAEIAKTEEKVKDIKPEEYRGEAVFRLLDLAKKHLELAKEALEEGKYGRAFGLATASYHEALNCQRIVERVEKIKESSEKLKEKLEELYPGVELPEDIKKCKLVTPPGCLQGEQIIVEKTPEGCPIFKCGFRQIPPEKEIVCYTLWDPVCGKDGKTYSNACFAEAAGVEIDYKGICREVGIPEIPGPEILPPEMIIPPLPPTS